MNANFQCVSARQIVHVKRHVKCKNKAFALLSTNISDLSLTSSKVYGLVFNKVVLNIEANEL